MPKQYQEPVTSSEVAACVDVVLLTALRYVFRGHRGIENYLPLVLGTKLSDEGKDRIAFEIQERLEQLSESSPHLP